MLLSHMFMCQQYVICGSCHSKSEQMSAHWRYCVASITEGFGVVCTLVKSVVSYNMFVQSWYDETIYNQIGG